VRLYADAFAAQPRLADDMQAEHRYNAACCAALAAAGKGHGADKLDPKERARLRRQALSWLRADLDVCDKRLASSQAAELQAILHRLQHWQQDTDLAGVRDESALSVLSAEERAAWRKLWADVAKGVRQAQEPR
jgi:hypothetical protein